MRSDQSGVTAARAVAAGAVALLAAAPASAAGGGLELVPDLHIYPILLLLFAALVVPLDRLLFRPLFRVLEQREEKIGGARRRAERLSREADQVVERYRAQVSETRERSERERKEQIASVLVETASRAASTRAEGEARVERARAEVNASLAQARAALRASTEQLARDAAERVLGRRLS
jgi:F-type H+-transporting ATPase subunit b